jgi:hypothetical protein
VVEDVLRLLAEEVAAAVPLLEEAEVVEDLIPAVAVAAEAVLHPEVAEEVEDLSPVAAAAAAVLLLPA